MGDVAFYLNKICASKGFVSAPRLSRFLMHVVTKTTRGETDDLRLSPLDLWNDVDKTSDVKGAALRVRERLAAYYAGQGNDDLIRIEIPEGGYVARIDDRRPPEVQIVKSLPASPPIVKRRVLILLEEGQDLFVQVGRTPSGQLSVEVTEFEPAVVPPTPTVPTTYARAEDAFTEEQLEELVVTSVQGVNTNGVRIYSYVQLSLRAFIAMTRKIRDRETFRSADYGNVLANGPGEPPVDLDEEFTRTYGLIDIPTPLQGPGKPLPSNAT